MTTNMHPADIAKAVAARELDKLIAQAKETPRKRKITVAEWRARTQKAK